MMVGHFLGGIAALIHDPAARQYLLLRRSAQKDFQSGDWECVTGRVDQGESYTQALHREVREEIGVEVQIDFLIGTTHFYRGAETPENELLGVIFDCTLADSKAVRLGDEHSEMAWMTVDEVRAALPESHWLRRVIDRAEWLRARLPEDVRRQFRENGFEL